jgi:hypothetical protein
MEIANRNDRSKAFRIFVSLIVIQKQASANIKLSIHKILFSSIMTYAFPALEFAANTSQLKLHCLQNEAFRVVDNFLRYTDVRDLSLALNAPHFYDCITELVRQEEEIFQNR